MSVGDNLLSEAALSFLKISSSSHLKLDIFVGVKTLRATMYKCITLVKLMGVKLSGGKRVKQMLEQQEEQNYQWHIIWVVHGQSRLDRERFSLLGFC